MPAASVQAVFIRAIPHTLCDWSDACIAFLHMPVSESAGAFGTAVQVGFTGRETVALAAKGALTHRDAGKWKASSLAPHVVLAPPLNGCLSSKRSDTNSGGESRW